MPLVPVHGGPLLSNCDYLFDPMLIPITLFAYDLSLVPVNEMVIVHNMVRYCWFMDYRLRRFTSGSSFYTRGKFFCLNAMFLQTLAKLVEDIEFTLRTAGFLFQSFGTYSAYSLQDSSIGLQRMWPKNLRFCFVLFCLFVCFIVSVFVFVFTQ